MVWPSCSLNASRASLQVPGLAKRLIDLPMDVLGVICRRLSLKDRCEMSLCPVQHFHSPAGMVLLLPSLTSTNTCPNPPNHIT